MNPFTLNPKVQLEFGQYISNKKIIIVGPSPHLQGTKLGKTIDKYDIVCRVNECYTNPIKKDYGKRTDIMFLGNVSTDNTDKLSFSVNENNQENSEQPLKWIIIPQSIQTEQGKLKRITDFLNTLKHIQSLAVNYQWWDTRCNEMGVLEREFYPYTYGANTGVLGMLFLLEYIDTFDVAGFSFYIQGLKSADRHHKTYIQYAGDSSADSDLEKPWKLHDPFKQVDYIKKFISNKNIRVDAYMKEHIFPECEVIQ